MCNGSRTHGLILHVFTSGEGALWARAHLRLQMSFVLFITWFFEFIVNLWIVLVHQLDSSPPKFLAGGLVASLKPWKHMIISRSFYLGNFLFSRVFGHKCHFSLLFFLSSQKIMSCFSIAFPQDASRQRGNMFRIMSAPHRHKYCSFCAN